MSKPPFFYVKRALQFFLLLLIIIVTSVTILYFGVSAPPERTEQKENEVNDVTHLNTIVVDQIKRPESTDEIIALVREQNGPISIGGARHSMGGQIGTEQALHLDMREFDQVLAFDQATKEITVQTGITWRKIQEYIDPHDLSVMIMQTYADFTVGGSLSVNVHGRYIGYGPLIHSVKSIKVVLPDGELVTASRTENAELFSGCIGGYGALGVIAEATLQLTDNCKVERRTEVMNATDYHDYFMRSVRNDSTIVFHNGDIYPDDYTEVRAVSYYKTDKTVTVADRLKPLRQDYRTERFAMWVVSEAPFGKWIRQHWGDPLIYNNEQVEWRNYEASYNAMELEPTSRKNSTYVLQEYFVPVHRFNSFVPKMAEVFQRYNVNVINVSIRHARPDTLSLLNWAPTEVFCFVVYYKQGTSTDEKAEVGVWTREMIDAVLSEEGSYYLPYQIHATPEQFSKAYPRSASFFALKKRIDPANKFRNKLWDAYYKP